MWQHNININALMAASLFASTDKARGPIQDVKVARVDDHNVYLATDSYIAGLIIEGMAPMGGEHHLTVAAIIDILTRISDDDPEGALTVPAGAVKEAHTKMKKAGVHKNGEIQLVLADGNYTFVGDGSHTISGKASSGDKGSISWRSFMNLYPGAATIEASTGIAKGTKMNFKMFSDMGKAALLLDQGFPAVTILGNPTPMRPQAFLTNGAHGLAYFIQMPVK